MNLAEELEALVACAKRNGTSLSKPPMKVSNMKGGARCLSQRQVNTIRELREEGESMEDLAERFGVSRRVIQNVINRARGYAKS